jgi:hypothetical protein
MAWGSMASGSTQTGARWSQDRQGAVSFSHVSAVACLGGLEDLTFQDLVVPSNGIAESMVGDSVNY